MAFVENLFSFKITIFRDIFIVVTLDYLLPDSAGPLLRPEKGATLEVFLIIFNKNSLGRRLFSEFPLPTVLRRRLFTELKKVSRLQKETGWHTAPGALRRAFLAENTVRSLFTVLAP